MSSSEIKYQMNLTLNEINKAKNTLEKYKKLQSKLLSLDGEFFALIKKLNCCDNSISSGAYISSPNVLADKVGEIAQDANSILNNMYTVMAENKKKISEYEIKITDLKHKYRSLEIKYENAKAQENSRR